MKPIKVLVIEDDEDYRVLIRDWLEEADLQVEIDEADSSKKGMKKMQDQSFDCVLIDYIIPGISGLNVIQEMRKNGNNTPFIIMTGYGDKELKKELIKEGASDYISKDDLNLENLQYKINAVVADTIQNVQEELEQSVKEGLIGQFIKSPPLIVDASLTIKEVVERINEHKVGSLLVKEGENYVGIVTKKDLVRKVIAKKLCRETTSVAEIMTRNFLTMDSKTSTEEAHEFMKEKRFRHLPVTQNGNIVGIVSVEDMLD